MTLVVLRDDRKSADGGEETFCCFCSHSASFTDFISFERIVELSESVLQDPSAIAVTLVNGDGSRLCFLEDNQALPQVNPHMHDIRWDQVEGAMAGS